jgi:hypothetical protein
MSAGRRGAVLALAFFAAALALCPRAAAQPVAQPFRAQPADPNVGKHTIWAQQLTPDQIRELLKQHFQNGDKNPQLEELLRQQMAKQKGVDPKQMDDAIKQLMNNKQFMDQIQDFIQKNQNQFPKNNGNGGQPNLNPDQIEQLKKLFGNGGDPFKVQPPKVNPVDPLNPPKIDPKVEPPKFPPFDPKVQPPQPPPFDPPQPPAFDPNNPFGNGKNDADKLAKQKAAEAIKAVWEKNVGPLDESPETKKAILDLLNDPDLINAFTDENGKNLFDFFKDGKGEDFKDLFKDLDGWEWPKLDLDFNWNWGKGPDWNLGGGNAPNVNWNAPRPNWGGGGGSGFNFAGMSVPVWLVIAILIAIALAVVWYKRDMIFVPRKATALAAAGAGDWPLDPRAINSREDVVKAFEYLSVLICGPGAKTWTHSTIADELTALAQTHGETAVKLARLYELARYAPLDEPLTRAELVEARRLVCDLAGMDEA